MRLRAVLAITAWVLTTAHAGADALSDCNQSRDGRLRIEACSAIVRDKSASIEQRATALRHRAGAHAEAGASDMALADLGEALALKPDYGFAWLARGNLRLSRNELDAALLDLDAAVRLMPESVAAHNARGYALLARGSLDAAIADFDRAIALDPRSASAWNNRGLAHRRKNMNDRAVADYTEAIRINPAYALAYANRARAYEAWGKKAEAGADAALATSLDPRLRSGLSGGKREPADNRVAAGSGISATNGKQIAQKNCAWCHGIERRGMSPNPRAPEFRLLYTRHPVESLREPLSRRIATPHDEMPRFALADTEIDSIIAYINSITPRR